MAQGGLGLAYSAGRGVPQDAPIDWLFENAGANGLALDRDFAWEGHADSEELHDG